MPQCASAGEERKVLAAVLPLPELRSMTSSFVGMPFSKTLYPSRTWFQLQHFPKVVPARAVPRRAPGKCCAMLEVLLVPNTVHHRSFLHIFLAKVYHQKFPLFMVPTSFRRSLKTTVGGTSPSSIGYSGQHVNSHLNPYLGGNAMATMICQSIFVSVGFASCTTAERALANPRLVSGSRGDFSGKFIGEIKCLQPWEEPANRGEK
ncbi:hypothetical protein B0J14DRAFT_76230 [Halenospora varia]|nr:hypothetical protein B0J14DRAFT_76230 [Halenospora varia]